jgi:transcriptional regulator with XRE-family HTH domain
MTALKQWMEQHEFTNSDLAERLGVSYETIYKMAEGKRPISGGVKYRIAAKFGIDTAEMLAPSQRIPQPEPIIAQ